jgi:hypothetical protein
VAGTLDALPKRAEANPSLEPSPAADEPESLGPVEEVDGLPVLAEVRPLPVRPAGRSPVVAQAAAVAATSFVAGAATIAVLRRRRTRRAAARPRLKRGGGELLQVVGSRSFLVDVHLLGGRD